MAAFATLRSILVLSCPPQLDMTFNLTLGLENLENKDGKPETYVLLWMAPSVVQIRCSIKLSQFPLSLFTWR
jgi:hypothetical protein